MIAHYVGALLPVLLIGTILAGLVYDFVTTSNGMSSDLWRRLASTRIGV